MTADLHQLLQSILIGLILSFFVAKLISFITTTATTTTTTTVTTTAKSRRKTSFSDEPMLHHGGDSDDTNSVLAEKGSVAGGDVALDDVDDDDDWEGVESTELDEAFSAATAFVAATTVERGKVKSEVELMLYGLYKIATEGPSSANAPPAFKLTARAKWNAWQKLGAMPPEDAMQKYVDIVTDLFPSWANGGADKTSKDDEIRTSESKEPIGPVFSSLSHEKESGNDLKMEAAHDFAREGEVDKLHKCIENGISVNAKDSEGRTPLHWAVDRGHLPVIELLFKNDAFVNAKDNEGQTPLHYAVVCDRAAVAEYLVKHNADVNAKDNDGNSPSDICEKNWRWMRSAEQVVA